MAKLSVLSNDMHSIIMVEHTQVGHAYWYFTYFYLYP